ncbi:thiolase family protein [Cumulibacter manganitolerans]|uniref:thiolase family protein n=1 Tax=Cumulibacter manganitolerans TaxID=1884992 RepID=UPI001296A96D|nr:thiolase family protein [Cumulibacter manganitolerans]
MSTLNAAIVGLGMTEMGKVYGRTATQFAVEAVGKAASDAGLGVADLDGLLVNCGLGRQVGMPLAADLGLRDLSVLSEIQSFGASAGVMVMQAAAAIAAGQATAVACVFADVPLTEGKRTGAAYADPKFRLRPGFLGIPPAGGLLGPNVGYALAARRHMDAYGTTSEQLGHVAVSTRKWAELNPAAQMRAPMTIDDHQSSRYIVDPLHLLDCCLVSNGAIAVIVTSGERARELAQPPVYLHGGAQSHPGYIDERDSEFGLVTGAKKSGERAMRMAGVRPEQIGVREIYDCYTYTTLVTLEDYGFCEKGEGGPLAESGALAPGGSLPTNTGGGQLSGYYMWGMTPLSEAVIQARGQGGERQVADHDYVLVSGNGGILAHHSTLILSPHPKEA